MEFSAFSEIDVILLVLRSRMDEMTDEQRVEVMQDIAHGYCVDCGRKIPLLQPYCYCMDDE